MEAYLVHFGYLALFAGTFLEGETIVLIASFFAHKGYFSLPVVIVVSGCGTLLGDQVAFFIGRTRGVQFIEKRPRLKSKLKRSETLIQNHRVLIILTFRFFYGLRTIIPLALGLFRTPPLLFIPLNILASFVWASLISLAGFYFGSLATAMLHHIANYEYYVLGGIAFVGMIFWLRLLYKNRKSH